MNFASYEQQENYAAPDYQTDDSSFAAMSFSPPARSMKLFGDKFVVPLLTNEIDRSRLIEQTENSLAHCSATIITGRAGMGKTTLVAQFAAQSKANISWYQVETANSDWKSFASYLAGSLNQTRTTTDSIKFDAAEVAA